MRIILTQLRRRCFPAAAALLLTCAATANIYTPEVNREAPTTPDVATDHAPRPDTDMNLAQQVNTFRRHAGLAPIQVDAELSAGCAHHARYLVRNITDRNDAIDPHEEDPANPHYTQAGARCAANAVIISAIGPEESVQDRMATFFHRVPLLSPHLVRT